MSQELIPDAVPVFAAETQAEREAIYGLRYRVYVDELKKANIENADRSRGWIKDPEDEEPYTILLYTGTPTAPTGTMRLRVWGPGQVDRHTREIYSIDSFPALLGQAIFEITRFIVSETVRGTPVAPSIFQEAYQVAVHGHHAHLGFLYCAPGLSRAYRRLGFRSYQGKLIESTDGLRVPMVMIAGDLGFFEKVGSPLTPLVRRHFPAEGGHHADLGDFRELVEGAFHQYELNPKAVWHDLQEEILGDQHPESTFLDRIPPDQVQRLAEASAVMEVPAGATVTRADLVEQEMYLVLSGEYEVLVNRRRVAVLRPGDVAGELALFTPSHQRTATIRALGGGRLVVVGRKFLDRLRGQDPALGFDLLYNLCRVMAARQASTDVVCYASPEAAE